MLKRLIWTFAIGICGGLLTHRWHMTGFELAMTVLFDIIAFGIPAALAVFAWAAANRRGRP